MLIDKLKQLGFKEYESRVLLALLRGSAMTVSEIASESKVIRTSIYEILKSFVTKGYCNEVDNNSILKYEITEPDIIFDKLKRDIKLKRDDEDNNITSTLKDLKSIRKKNIFKKESLNVQLIRGYNQHRESKFIELVNSSKKEILFMMKFEGNISLDIDNSIMNFFKRGGTIKSVYEYTLDFKVRAGNRWKPAVFKEFINILSAYGKSGEKIRISKEAVPALTIFDKETVFLLISDKDLPRHQEADLIIRNKQFAERMSYVFNNYFKESESIKNFKPPITDKTERIK